eukprot:2983512-Alexandrium_andersonii.AAC.1
MLLCCRRYTRRMLAKRKRAPNMRLQHSEGMPRDIAYCLHKWPTEGHRTVTHTHWPGKARQD